MPWALIGAGLTYGFSGGLAPGSTNALIVAQTLRHGPAEGLKVALAPLLTDAPIVLAGWWLAGALASSQRAIGAISLAGSIVLVWLATECFRARRPVPTGAVEAAQSPGSLWKGVLANGLNPHPWLFWLTIGGPTLREAAAIGPGAVIAFLLAMYISLVGSKMALALAAAGGRRWLSGPSYVWAMRLMGALLLAFAARFAWFGWNSL